MLICLSLAPEFNASNTCDCKMSDQTDHCMNNTVVPTITKERLTVPSAGKVRLLKYTLCPPETPSSCFTDLFSCSDVLSKFPNCTSGYYNIGLTNGSTVSVYCDMEGVNCACLNMSDPTEQCPPGFRLYEENNTRACGRQSSGCHAVEFPSNITSYTQVCGRVTGYQKGSPDAVDSRGPQDINQEYVDGVSISRGNPRKHVWTFMAALQENSFYTTGDHECPCAPNNSVTPQSFVGNDYILL